MTSATSQIGIKMLDKKQVNNIIDSMGLGDFSQATIRDIQALSRVIEEKTG